MKKIFYALLIAGVFLLSGSSKAQTQDYVVLTTIMDTTDAYYEVVHAVEYYRNAPVIQFSASNINGLLPVLSILQPRYAAIVVKPLELDINFVRKFLMMSTQLDSDPFSDFSYGFITGATGQDALDFCDQIIYAETHGIQNFPLNVGGYAASSLNLVYHSPGDYLQYLNCPNYSCIYMETSDLGTGLDYFLANSGNMLNNKVLDIGHNGDPHMLWLFEGGNMSPNPPVWNYDPAKIEDTAYARVGLSSYEIAELNLYPAVVFNGACHSGEPKRVMVEGDIAATFGDTQGQVEFYEMSDTFSFALSILKTGITGYFAPCGANNANDQSEDMYNAFLYNEPLGDIHKRSNDGVVMGFLGNPPNLKIFTQGASAYGCDVLASGTFDPSDWSGACYMLGGKANRIYFGDPLFNPLANHHSPQLNIVTASQDSINATTLDINLQMNKPSSPYFPVWEKFHFSDTRVYLPIELPDYCGEITGFTVLSASGSYHQAFYAQEDFDGKNILHIEADIPDDMYSAITFSMLIRINFVNVLDIPQVKEDLSLELYPNPASEEVLVALSNQFIPAQQLAVYDASGKEMVAYQNLTSNLLKIKCKDYAKGMYFVRVVGKNGRQVNKKFLVE
ncbi:MAG: T9SS type A sorting domain-containing protein [Bacteroidales bacterium]|nr:T9SS type A sorting domain-containing protein [Bacteroidales bacterium]MCF8454534.1 T9SS type A sorting domain-containing protein [Bacteroidales bacterium]